MELTSLSGTKWRAVYVKCHVIMLYLPGQERLTTTYMEESYCTLSYHLNLHAANNFRYYIKVQNVTH